MDRINLEETKESLADVIARVESGETIVVTRGEAVVAKIEPLAEPSATGKLPVDTNDLRHVTSTMRMQEVSAGEFMRWMRDDARY